MGNLCHTMSSKLSFHDYDKEKIYIHKIS